jgi:hypothetical protein
VFDAKPGERCILEHGHDGPTLTLGMRPAQLALVLD